MPSSSASLTTLFNAISFSDFHFNIFAILGVLLPYSSLLFEASSEIMFWPLAILPVILIISANAARVIMPSFNFRSIAHLLRFFAHHVAFGFFISTLFHFVGICFPRSSLLEEISVRLWAVILCLFIYNADTIVVQFTSISDLFRPIPRNEGFGNLIQDLTRRVQRRFPNSSPLDENSARAWALFTSRSIYSYTGNVISGSLSCAVLISFLISHHETPMYVFVIWAICLVSYIRRNRVTIPGN